MTTSPIHVDWDSFSSSSCSSSTTNRFDDDADEPSVNSSGIIVMTARNSEGVWRALDDRICEALGSRTAMRLGRRLDGGVAAEVETTPLDEVAAHLTRARGALRLLSWRACSLDAPPSFAAPLTAGYVLCSDLAETIATLEEDQASSCSKKEERRHVISILPVVARRLEDLKNRIRGLVIARAGDATSTHELRVLLRCLATIPRRLAAAIMALAAMS